MSFMYPLGLLGLIGIPILIIIYIIKSRYAEQTIASVYLWELSEKFLKRKKRVNLFSGILGLIMQILAIAAISLAVAHPVFILHGAASDYCFILDASGSMNTTADGKSRFDRAKDEITDIIEGSADGSNYTLVVAGSSVYVAFENVRDKASALSSVQSVKCSYSDIDCADAAPTVQRFFTKERSPITYLVTDKDTKADHITVVNVAKREINHALMSYEYRRASGGVTALGQAISNTDATLEIELYADGEKAGSTRVSAKKDTPVNYIIDGNVSEFRALRVVIKNPDGLPEDNEGIIYMHDSESNNRSLIISDAASYLDFALRASGKTSVDTVSTKKYAEAPDSYTGYGLYVFDTFNNIDRLPKELPASASVWLFNVHASINKAGFGFREVVAAEGESYFEPTYSRATDSLTRALTKDLLRQSVAVKKYVRYSQSRSYTPVMSCNGDGLIFAGNNEYGNRQVVFAFDIHDSDLGLKSDFLALTDNLLSYSFPDVIEKTLFAAGETMTINVPAGTTDLVLESPSGKKSYPDFSSAYATSALNEFGTYRLTATVGGSERKYSLFTALPKGESYDISAKELDITMLAATRKTDGYFDSLLIYFIVAAVALLVDWGVYCYEQYQLR